jgi:tetratricopeptide (TPR) repeat protein
VRIDALYTQYVRSEADTVIPRGLALFPQSADLRNIQARDLRSRGKLQDALDATKQAVSLDSTMVQGDLVVAQLEMELGRPDSALSSLHRALARGADSAVVAQFAVAKGNSLFQAANGTHSSADFRLALRFFTFADSTHTSVQATFLTGATALSLAQAALTEAPKLTDKVESCKLARVGADMMRMAKTGLDSGRDLYADAAKQYLDYLGQLDPYVGPQVAAFCSG